MSLNFNDLNKHLKTRQTRDARHHTAPHEILDITGENLVEIDLPKPESQPIASTSKSTATVMSTADGGHLGPEKSASTSTPRKIPVHARLGLQNPDYFIAENHNDDNMSVFSHLPAPAGFDNNSNFQMCNNTIQQNPFLTNPFTVQSNSFQTNTPSSFEALPVPDTAPLKIL